MNSFFLFGGLPLPIAIFFTIALIIVLIGHTIAFILFVVGGKAVASAAVVDDESGNRFHFIFLVPALNEEVTIADSVERLLQAQTTRKTILVIDDGSDDGTPAVLAGMDYPQLEVLRREKPDAQKGKAAALNAGWRYVRDEVLSRPEFHGVTDDDVIFVIVDADGRMDPAAPRYFGAQFTDPKVAGVQLSVRIYNRYNPLTWCQDVEFGVYGGLYQIGRSHWGTAGMGGNGQANRLSALNSVVGDHDGPWRDYLTEDQDIGLTLLEHGWQGMHEVRCTVAQQGVSDIRRLYRQRTRWSQGNIQAMRHLPNVGSMSSNAMAKIDLTWGLLQPPLQGLVGVATIVALCCAFFLGTPFISPNDQYEWLWLVFLFFLAFGGTALGCMTLGRGHGVTGYLKGLCIAIPYAFYSWLLWPVLVRATWRQLRGATGWDKTAREPMDPSVKATAAS